MSKPKTNPTVMKQFEKFTTPTPPAEPREFEKLASNAKALPQVGYAREFPNAEQRGREMMDAGRRGERNFPPARQVVKP
jgi:hypothetical protein